MIKIIQDQKSYARGYAAGRAKKQKERDLQKQRIQELAFWERAYLVSLGQLANGTPWLQGEKILSDVAGRSSVAKDFADQAVINRRKFRL